MKHGILLFIVQSAPPRRLSAPPATGLPRVAAWKQVQTMATMLRCSHGQVIPRIP